MKSSAKELSINNYDQSAQYYSALLGDAYSHVDIDFYLRLADHGMRILDVGCGTGRVSLELARNRKGCVIAALDNSGRPG